MDFSISAEEADFQAEVRRFMADAITDQMLDRAYATGTIHDWDFHRALGANGWLGLSWPRSDGGQERTPMEAALFYEEANRALAPLYGMNTTMVAARAVLTFGSEALRADIVPRVMRGEFIICLGFSEPDSGSDVAGARTRAVRDGDVWVVNGQKVFTSTAEECAYVLLLVRTDVAVPKHQGLSVFLVPMDTPGIEIAPIMTLGERTNMTYYRDVVVPDSFRVGEVNGGWEVMTRALSFERGGHGFQGHLIRLLEDTVEALDQLAEAGVDDLRDDRCDDALGRFATEIEVARLLDYRTAWMSSAGHQPSIEGSMAKLYSSEAFTRACSDFMDLLGPYGLLQRGEAGAPVGGAIEYAHRFATPTTVYGGASEVQKSIIAERALGLPPEPVSAAVGPDVAAYDPDRPLAGLVVVDFTHLVAGPFCTMMLADAGAEVIKIEPPWGDNSRRRGPTRREGGIRVSSFLAAGNRGKHSVALDLKTEEGCAALRRLLDRADVVIENFAPGVIARMGFDLVELRRRRPEVITTSISLFGGRAQGGPFATRAGLAIVAEAESGLANLCRDVDGRPVPFGAPLGDMASGLGAYGGIMTALFARERTGVGRHIDISMVHTLIAFNGVAIAGESLGGAGEKPVPTSPYGYFAAKDGWVALAVNVDPLWVKFTAAIGRPELATDPRYADHDDRDPRGDEVRAIVEDFTSTRTCDEVIAVLSPVGVPCGKLTTPADLIASPEMWRLGILRSADDGAGGEVTVVDNLLGYEGGPMAIPGVGEHTDEVLGRLASSDQQG